MEEKIVSWVGYGYVTEGDHDEDSVKCEWCNHLVPKKEAIQDVNLYYCSSVCYIFSKEH